MRRGRGLANFGGTGGLAKGLDAIMHDVDGDKDGRVTVREFSLMTACTRSGRASRPSSSGTQIGDGRRPARRARRDREGGERARRHSSRSR